MNVSKHGQGLVAGNTGKPAILKHQTTAPYQMRLVILESPYKGNATTGITTAEHEAYARACLHDSLLRCESPLASHLLYTQPGVLNDANANERAHGINAGHAWLTHCDAVVVYTDLGISDGMQAGINLGEFYDKTIEYRTILEKDNA